MQGSVADWVILTATLVVSLAAFTLLWVISLRKNDASIVDWYWGLGFSVIALLSMLALEGIDATRLALVGATIVWSLRLTIYMIVRHVRKGREDARYAAMRAAGGATFKRDSLFKIFWLQAVIMWIIATPLHAGLVYPEADVLWVPLVAGFILFAVGLTIETIADAQLDRFVRIPGNAGRLMTEGLFSWSRHPNYFGETILWWGMGLVGFALSGLWWAFIGPAVLTFLLLKVSGVPMLDAHLSVRPGWSDYAARTSAFWPRPPRGNTVGSASREIP